MTFIGFMAIIGMTMRALAADLHGALSAFNRGRLNSWKTPSGPWRKTPERVPRGGGVLQAASMKRTCSALLHSGSNHSPMDPHLVPSGYPEVGQWLARFCHRFLAACSCEGPWARDSPMSISNSQLPTSSSRVQGPGSRGPRSKVLAGGHEFLDLLLEALQCPRYC